MASWDPRKNVCTAQVCSLHVISMGKSWAYISHFCLMNFPLIIKKNVLSFRGSGYFPYQVSFNNLLWEKFCSSPKFLHKWKNRRHLSSTIVLKISRSLSRWSLCYHLSMNLSLFFLSHSIPFFLLSVIFISRSLFKDFFWFMLKYINDS